MLEKQNNSAVFVAYLPQKEQNSGVALSRPFASPKKDFYVLNPSSSEYFIDRIAQVTAIFLEPRVYNARSLPYSPMEIYWPMVKPLIQHLRKLKDSITSEAP